MKPESEQVTCKATEIVLGRTMNALEIENDLLAATIFVEDDIADEAAALLGPDEPA